MLDLLCQKQAGTMKRETAYSDAICIKIWASVHMAILADAILGVLLDCGTASR